MTWFHLRTPLALLALAVVAACGGKAAYLQGALSTSADVVTYEADGATYRVVTVSPGDTPGNRHLYFVGGSGCAALAVYMQTYVEALDEAFVLHGIEKTGTPQRGLGLSCPPEFWENYTYEQLVERNQKGLDIVQRATGAPIEAIIGVSEGGPVAVELAAAHPEIPALVLLGAGGLAQREELLILARRQGREAAMRASFDQVAARPDSLSDRVMGLPHRYWSSVLDADPGPLLKRLKQRVLIVIGEADESVPVESARRADDLAARSTLVVVPDASHTFDTPNGNQRATVMGRVSDFLAR
ncbi:alpha/beta fold hydrolase [Sagittula sp. S175]|uniref:alpha/beta fold hydrolase n=1 Tax=Sagittula sp. S175 TaxID=3415129 RepID=UPI003C7CDF54